MAADYAGMADDEDMTYPAILPVDQRVRAKLAQLETTIHKQHEEIEHMKRCIHRLMNPGEGDDGEI